MSFHDELVAHEKAVRLEVQFFEQYVDKYPTPWFGQDFPADDINEIVSAWKELKRIREKRTDSEDYFAQGQIEFVSRKINLWTSDFIAVDYIKKLNEHDVALEYAIKEINKKPRYLWCGC